MLFCTLAVVLMACMAGCGGAEKKAVTLSTSPLLGAQTVLLQANGGGTSVVTHSLTINFTVNQ